MLFLNVPFSQKDEAKALGARWNADKKKWYVPDGLDATPFSRWTEARQQAPKPLPVTKEALLFIDLVPNSAWFSNLRSELTKIEWDLVKKATFKAASYLCEVCGKRGQQHPVECHERWHYDSQTKVQTLVRTIALCPACHESTHYGLASVRGRDQEAKQHLMLVNGWNGDQANQHISQAMDEWKRRSEVKWKLDARWLLDFVHLSEETQKKIIDFAAGLGERKIQDWQQMIVDDHAQKAGINRK